MTNYELDQLALAQEYIRNKGWTKHQHTVPTRAGLATVLDVSKKTLVRWGESYDEWRVILEKLNDLFDVDLVERALNGDLPASMAKEVLARMLDHDGERSLPKEASPPQPVTAGEGTGEGKVVRIEDYDRIVTGQQSS